MKILIVDDQAHARDSLIRLCERNEDVQVVGEATCGMAAIDATDKLHPDLMILDVELPDMSGFELLRAVGADIHPLGIMVSTCAEHAVRAFAAGAIDSWGPRGPVEGLDKAIAPARHRFDHAGPGHPGRVAP